MRNAFICFLWLIWFSIYPRSILKISVVRFFHLHQRVSHLPICCGLMLNIGQHPAGEPVTYAMISLLYKAWSSSKTIKQHTDSISHLNPTFTLVPSSQCLTGSMYRYEEMLWLAAVFAAGYKYSSLVFPVGPFMLKISTPHLYVYVCVKNCFVNIAMHIKG